MKLLLAIVSNDDVTSVMRILTKNKFQVTKLATTGGFLSKGNATLIVGCEDEKVQNVIDLIGQESKKRTEYVPSSITYDTATTVMTSPIAVTVGGATIFVLNVEQFVKI